MSFFGRYALGKVRQFFLSLTETNVDHETLFYFVEVYGVWAYIWFWPLYEKRRCIAK